MEKHFNQGMWKKWRPKEASSSFSSRIRRPADACFCLSPFSFASVAAFLAAWNSPIADCARVAESTACTVDSKSPQTWLLARDQIRCMLNQTKRKIWIKVHSRALWKPQFKLYIKMQTTYMNVDKEESLTARFCLWRSCSLGSAHTCKHKYKMRFGKLSNIWTEDPINLRPFTS